MNPPKQHSFNFEPLHNYKTGFTTYLSTPILLIWAVLPFIALTVMLAIPALFLNGQESSSIGIFSVVSAVVVGTAMVWLFIYSRRQARKREEILRAFAQANNLTYKRKASLAETHGSIFGIGSSPSKLNVMTGHLQGLPFSSYEYYYETGSGKSRQVHDAMIFEVTLPRVLPQFVIDSQLENVLPAMFQQSQKIELEGDFHKYFDLYAPDTYGVTALTILAPDAMQVLMQFAVLCDIEIVQNKLYFYWARPAKNQTDYKDVYQTAEAVLVKLKDKLTKDDIFATTTQQQIHISEAAQGIRLKRSIWPTVLSVFVVVMVIGLQMLGSLLEFFDNDQIAGTLAGIIGLVIFLSFPAVIIFVMVKIQRRKKLLKAYKAQYKK